jgi:hypothetical protein
MLMATFLSEAQWLACPNHSDSYHWLQREKVIEHGQQLLIYQRLSEGLVATIHLCCKAPLAVPGVG